MLSANNITRELGGRVILDGVSFVINDGEAAGIAGPNGSGKTTLLRILAGELATDVGSVDLPRNGIVGYLPQGWERAPGTTVGDCFPALFAPGDAGDPGSRLGAELADVAARLGAAKAPEMVSPLEDEYDRLLDQLSATLPGAGIAGVREVARDTLGLRDVPATMSVGELSGGELTKLGLLNLAASNPTVLLLDEPTNHLDLRGIEWVQAFFRAFRGPVALVSHDRALLDACATHIVEIDPHTHRAETFTGGYSAYAAEKARREEEQWERFRRQQREERQLRRTISAIESRSRNVENRTIDFYFRKRAAKVARRAVTLKARLEREIDSSTHVARPEKAAQGFYGEFASTAGGASRLLAADNVAIEMGGRPLFSGLTFQANRGERVVLTGPNGCGKTTLLRAVLGQHPVAAGRLELSGSAVPGYLAQQEESALSAEEGRLTPIELLRRACALPEAEAYNFLHRFLFGADMARTAVERLSYGERRRLALARLVLQGSNLLLLDEPTNHLDLPSREAFEAALDAFDGAAVIVTHDRYFIERFADTVVEIG
ncbi:MAG TPA: ABC-F family ATP-binding cassette domain-containing protein [Tepidiformaceae bacterium]|nr:ABC-F family ATP-binding cassette domain-containing protein [Tepidiformaceae bacterium]